MSAWCHAACWKTKRKANVYSLRRSATAAGAILPTLSPNCKPSQGFKARESELPKKHTNKADESIIPGFLGDMFQSVCSVFLQEMFNIYRWRYSGLLVFLDSFLTCSLFSPHLLPSFVAFRCKWPQQTPVQDPGGILHRQPRENVGDRCRNALITHSQHPALPAAGGKSSLC